MGNYHGVLPSSGWKGAMNMNGKRIQFGHTQGLLIGGLGVILLVSQVLIALQLLPTSAPNENNSAVVGSSTVSRVMLFLPGALGIITVSIGSYFLLQDRFKNRNANPPAKTKSGFPM